MKYVTVATAVALVAGLILGAAYGSKIPVVGALAQKLPGAGTPAAK